MMRQAFTFWMRHRAQAIWLTAVVAIAVAAVTSTWAVAYGLWFQRPDLRHPDRLVSVGWTTATSASRLSAVSAYEFPELRRVLASSMSLASFEYATNWYLPGLSGIESLNAAYVSDNFFEVLGAAPVAGRLFEPGDGDAAAGMPRAVVSERLWRRVFQGDPGGVGRDLDFVGDFEQRRAHIVGVLGAGASVPGLKSIQDGSIDIFVAAPDGLRPGGSRSRRIYDRGLIGRLHPGIARDHAQARTTAVLQQIDREHPLFNRERRASVVPLHDIWFGEVRPMLALLAAAAAFVVLITLANAAGLMSAVASRRVRERAIRSAVGARTVDLMRQTITEMGIVASVACGAALLLSHIAIQAFVFLAPQDVPRAANIGMPWHVLVVAAAAAFAFSVLLALVPVLVSRRQDVLSGLQSSGTTSTAAPRILFVRRAAIGLQTAIVLALLAAAGLVSATLWQMLHRPLGFNADRVVIARIRPTARYYLDPPRYQAMMDAVRAEAAGLPGASAVALAFDPPLADYIPRMQVRFVDPDRAPAMVGTKFVTDGFFEAIGASLIAGRDFEKGDYATGAVTIVNQMFAEQFFGSVHRAIGAEFDFGPRHRIVGVVANIREEGITTADKPVHYPLLSAALRTPGVFHVVARGSHDDTSTATQLAAAVRRADPSLFVDVSMLDDRLRRQTAVPRMQSVLLLMLAAVTLALAALGIHATVEQLVEDRRREMAIRSVLGSTAGGLIVLAVRGVAAAIVAGVIAGAGLSWIVARVTRQFLFEVSPFEPGIWLTGALLLVGVAFTAAWLPARRAARVDPAIALRA